MCTEPLDTGSDRVRMEAWFISLKEHGPLEL